MVPLYKISNEFMNILYTSDENGVITEDQILKLKTLEFSLKDKAINIASYIRNLECELNYVQEAKIGMIHREKRLENNINSLRNYLLNNLENLKIKEILDSPYFTIKVKKCPESVIIENEKEEELTKYKKIKEIISFDKAAIKLDLKNGIEIKGAHLEQKNRLEIK